MLREFEFTDAEFDEIRKRIYNHAGISLAPTKRELVYTRLRKRLRHYELSSFSEYLDLLATTPDELQSFINSLTTNHTSFFRESAHFDALRAFIEARTRRDTLRVWCAASSTGEEPYSIAITVAEAFGSLTPDATIVASDIDTDVLAKAKAGLYPLKAVADVPASVVKRYFLKGTGRNEGWCRVVPELQRLIEFKQLNLLDRTWPIEGLFDVIFCRNVFFYFDKPTQCKIVERLRAHVEPDGIFFTGHSENFVTFVNQRKLFKPVGHSIYRPIDKGTA